MNTTFDIFNDVRGIRSLFDRIFDERLLSGKITPYPYINLYEENDIVHIKVLAPGEKAEDIDLQLIDDNLIIELKKHNDSEEENYIRRERTFGTFKKSVKLPYKVDSGNIEAKVKDGLLIIKLVNSEEAKLKKIEIQ